MYFEDPCFEMMSISAGDERCQFTLTGKGLDLTVFSKHKLGTAYFVRTMIALILFIVLFSTHLFSGMFFLPVLLCAILLFLN
jgi:hypothetical protein